MKGLAAKAITAPVTCSASKAVFLALVTLFFYCGVSFAQTVVVENPAALPVVDQAELLTPEQETSISTRLKALANTDGTQVAVLTVPTTGDEDIFTFAQRTATEWGIGQSGDNSGVLFVVARDDRKSRIHVGYGLEGRLTDALSKRILSTAVSPEFRSGDYYAGISQGVDSIIAAVKGEYTAPPADDGGAGSGDLLFFIVVIALVMFFLYNAGGGGRGGRRRRSGVSVLPNVWTTGGGSSGGWGHSSGDSGGGGGFGGGFGGGSFGGGGASDSW